MDPCRLLARSISISAVMSTGRGIFGPPLASRPHQSGKRVSGQLAWAGCRAPRVLTAGLVKWVLYLVQVPLSSFDRHSLSSSPVLGLVLPGRVCSS